MTRLAAATAVMLALACASGASPLRAQPADIAAPIAALNAGLAQIERAAPNTSFAQRYQMLAPIVDRAFNLPFVLQEVVGPRWPSIPADQQQRLLAAFRAFTIATYVSSFDSNSGDRFQLLPATHPYGPDIAVETRIVPRTGDPTEIDYVMRQGPAGWQAINVLLDGTISRVAVQRSDFRSLLDSGNGAEALIDSLTRKVENLSNGTVRP